MSRITVALLDDYQGVGATLADWTGLPVTLQVHRDHLADDDALVARLQGVDVVVAMRERTPLPRSVLSRLPQLRLVVTTAMNNASIDMVAARELGIDVCGTALPSRPTVELTWALLMSVVRQLPQHDADLRTGGWQLGLGRELGGMTLGVLGLGRIGSRIARIARGFEMDVVGWGRRFAPGDVVDEVRIAAFDDVFAQSDVVAVCLRLTPETRGLVGARQLQLLGPDGYLVNTARGPIVDEPALVAALHSGGIAGAGLDVYDVEPLPADSPLRSAPNTVLTPHIGYVAVQTYRLAWGDVVEDVEQWLAGRPVRVVN